MKSFIKPITVVVLFLALAMFGTNARAALIVKADNTNSLSNSNSWVGGIVPGASDIVVWNNTVITNITSSVFGSNSSWQGIQIVNPGSNITFGIGTTNYGINLGSSGIDMAASTVDFTINRYLNLVAPQTWDVASGRTLTVNVGFGSSTITNNGNRLTIQGAGNTVIPSVINGSGGVTKAAAGTLTFSGANTFTGGSTINGGTILIAVNNVSTTSGALGTSTAAVALGDATGSANASLLTSGAFTFANAVTVASGSSGTATLGGNSADTSTFSGNITLNKSATITAVSGGNATFSGIISGSGFGITKTGAGIVTLSGSNTFTGGTTINAGSLRLGTNNALASTGAMTLNGGTFSSRGFTNMLGALSIQSSSIINLGTNGTTATLTFASGSYTAGTLTISNWTGTAGVSGTADKIFITAAPSTTFLTNITFYGYQAGALRLGTGEIVPSGALPAMRFCEPCSA